MPYKVLAGLLISLTVCHSSSFAEITFEVSTPTEDCTEVACEVCSCEDEECECQAVIPSFSDQLWTANRTYAWQEHSAKFVPTSADDFGWFSWESTPYLALDSDFGMTAAASIHWLRGPTQTPIPPRLYDFSIGLQARKDVGHDFSYDIAASIGVFSDFEDSARDGVRYLGHAVGFVHMHQDIDFVFGVDYLDRDDIRLLPVIGFSVRNSDLNIIADLIFPRPRISFVLDDHQRLFFLCWPTRRWYVGY